MGVRRRQPQFKVWAVVVEVMALIVFGINVGQKQFGWFGQDTFETSVTGPSTLDKTPSVTGEWRYHVNADAVGARHLLEFTPVAKYGELAKGSLTLRYEVRSPQGEMVAQGRETLLPAKGRNWSTLRASFEPRVEDEHTMLLEIPKPAGTVRVKVRVLR